MALRVAVRLLRRGADAVRTPSAHFEWCDAAGVLVGFYYFVRTGTARENGLGLRPELTGLGHGPSLVRAGSSMRASRFQPEPLTPLRRGVQRARDRGL